MLYWTKTYITVFLVSMILSLIGTPLVRWLALRLGVVDIPNSKKIHSKPVPLWGGVIIFAACAIAILQTFDYSNPLKAIMIGGFVVLLVGIIDDVNGGISACLKFVILMIVALILTRYGVILNLFHNYYLDAFFTVLWIVGLTSAFNGIDNMDGLASGIACITSTIYFIIAYQTGLWGFGILAIALAGSNLGFLRYNFNPATIFMGDAGSFFLGFTLAAMGVMGEWTENSIISCIIPVLILGFPIFDFSYIIIWRQRNGVTHNLRQIISHCDKDHISHRLVDLGLNQRKAVGLIYLISFALGLGAIVLRNSQLTSNSALLLLQGFIIALIVITLLKLGAQLLRRNNKLKESLTELKVKIGVVVDIGGR